jgi:DNA-binding transcriptional MerR regulator
MARKKVNPPEGDTTGADAPKKLYSVGEVVKQSGISRQVLHNYTVLGLLRVAERTPTNRRYYDEAVFRRIKLIRKMLDSGYTLQSLRDIFPWEE